MFKAQSGRLSFGSQLTYQQRQSAMRHRLGWLSVLSAASVGFCAVASHRAGIPLPRLAPSLLGVLRMAG